MVVRAFEDPDARMQEEILKRTLTLTKQLDFTVIISSFFFLNEKINLVVIM